MKELECVKCTGIFFAQRLTKRCPQCRKNVMFPKKKNETEEEKKYRERIRQAYFRLTHKDYYRELQRKKRYGKKSNNA